MKALLRMGRSYPWLVDAFDALRAAGYRVDWSRPDREIVVRPAARPFPVVWIDARGRVDVTPFRDDCDHPGYRLRRDERSAENVFEILRRERM